MISKDKPLFAWVEGPEGWVRERLPRLGASLPQPKFDAVIAQWFPDAVWVHPVTGELA